MFVYTYTHTYTHYIYPQQEIKDAERSQSRAKVSAPILRAIRDSWLKTGMNPVSPSLWEDALRYLFVKVRL